MINGVIQILIDDDRVATAAGVNKADNKTKIYPSYCPTPEESPYYVLRIAGKNPIECKGTAPTDFVYQFNVYAYAKNYEAVDEMSKSVELALNNYEGEKQGVTFKQIRFVTLRDDAVEVQSTILSVRIMTYEAEIYEAPTT